MGVGFQRKGLNLLQNINIPTSRYGFGDVSPPLQGDSFYWQTPSVSNAILKNFLEDFSKQNPKELKIVITDNIDFHAIKNFTIPNNIKFIRIPLYSPELNPAEKVWR